MSTRGDCGLQHSSLFSTSSSASLSGSGLGVGEKDKLPCVTVESRLTRTRYQSSPRRTSSGVLENNNNNNNKSDKSDNAAKADERKTTTLVERQRSGLERELRGLLHDLTAPNNGSKLQGSPLRRRLMRMPTPASKSPAKKKVVVYQSIAEFLKRFPRGEKQPVVCLPRLPDESKSTKLCVTESCITQDRKQKDTWKSKVAQSETTTLNDETASHTKEKVPLEESLELQWLTGLEGEEELEEVEGKIDSSVEELEEVEGKIESETDKQGDEIAVDMEQKVEEEVKQMSPEKSSSKMMETTTSVSEESEGIRTSSGLKDNSDDSNDASKQTDTKAATKPSDRLSLHSLIARVEGRLATPSDNAEKPDSGSSSPTKSSVSSESDSDSQSSDSSSDSEGEEDEEEDINSEHHNDINGDMESTATGNAVNDAGKDCNSTGGSFQKTSSDTGGQPRFSFLKKLVESMKKNNDSQPRSHFNGSDPSAAEGQNDAQHPQTANEPKKPAEKNKSVFMSEELEKYLTEISALRDLRQPMSSTEASLKKSPPEKQTPTLARVASSPPRIGKTEEVKGIHFTAFESKDALHTSYPSSPSKTADITKIKGWKKKFAEFNLASQQENQSREDEQEVEKISRHLINRLAKSRLVRRMKPEEYRQLGLRIRRRNMVRGKELRDPEERSPVKKKRKGQVKYLAGDQHEQPSKGKIYGWRRDGKFASKAAIVTQTARKSPAKGTFFIPVQSLGASKLDSPFAHDNISRTHMSQLQKSPLMATKFRIVNNTIIRTDTKGHKGQKQTDRPKGSALGQEKTVSDANIVTESMALAALTALRNAPTDNNESESKEVDMDCDQIKTECTKPGCHYGCVCHLVSEQNAGAAEMKEEAPAEMEEGEKEEESTATPEPQEPQYDLDNDDTPYPPAVTLANPAPGACTKEWCRLGCVCESINSSVTVKREHCDKLRCMFGCACSHELGPSHGTRSLLSSMHADPEPDLTRAVDLADHDVSPKSGYGKIHSKGARKSVRLRGKPTCSLSHIDKIQSLALYDPKMWMGGSSLRNRAGHTSGSSKGSGDMMVPLSTLPKSSNKTKVKRLDKDGRLKQATVHRVMAGIVERPALDPASQEMMAEVEKLLQEADDGITSCARTAVYISVRRQVQLEQNKKNAEKASREENTPEKASQQQTIPSNSGSNGKQRTEPEGNLAASKTQRKPSVDSERAKEVNKDKGKFRIQMVLLQRKNRTKQNGEVETPEKPEIPHLLEVHSDCQWDRIRSTMLGKVSVLAEKEDYPSPTSLVIDEFNIEIMPKPDKLTVIPRHLRKSLHTEEMLAIRLRITKVDPEESAGESMETEASSKPEEDQSMFEHTGISGFANLKMSMHKPRDSITLARPAQFPAQQDSANVAMTGYVRSDSAALKVATVFGNVGEQGAPIESVGEGRPWISQDWEPASKIKTLPSGVISIEPDEPEEGEREQEVMVTAGPSKTVPDDVVLIEDDENPQDSAENFSLQLEDGSGNVVGGKQDQGTREKEGEEKKREAKEGGERGVMDVAVEEDAETRLKLFVPEPEPMFVPEPEPAADAEQAPPVTTEAHQEPSILEQGKIITSDAQDGDAEKDGVNNGLNIGDDREDSAIVVEDGEQMVVPVQENVGEKEQVSLATSKNGVGILTEDSEAGKQRTVVENTAADSAPPVSPGCSSTVVTTSSPIVPTATSTTSSATTTSAAEVSTCKSSATVGSISVSVTDESSKTSKDVTFTGIIRVPDGKTILVPLNSLVRPQNLPAGVRMALTSGRSLGPLVRVQAVDQHQGKQRLNVQPVGPVLPSHRTLGPPAARLIGQPAVGLPQRLQLVPQTGCIQRLPGQPAQFIPLSSARMPVGSKVVLANTARSQVVASNALRMPTPVAVTPGKPTQICETRLANAQRFISLLPATTEMASMIKKQGNPPFAHIATTKVVALPVNIASMSAKMAVTPLQQRPGAPSAPGAPAATVMSGGITAVTRPVMTVTRPVMTQKVVTPPPVKTLTVSQPNQPTVNLRANTSNPDDSELHFSIRLPPSPAAKTASTTQAQPTPNPNPTKKRSRKEKLEVRNEVIMIDDDADTAKGQPKVTEAKTKEPEEPKTTEPKTAKQSESVVENDEEDQILEIIDSEDELVDVVDDDDDDDDSEVHIESDDDECEPAAAKLRKIVTNQEDELVNAHLSHIKSLKKKKRKQQHEERVEQTVDDVMEFMEELVVVSDWKDVNPKLKRSQQQELGESTQQDKGRSRITHMSRERERRSEISYQFRILGNSLFPELDDKKLNKTPKITILEAACDKIKSLQKQEVMLKKVCEIESDRREKLIAKLRVLRGMKKASFAGMTVDETTGEKYLTKEPEISTSACEPSTTTPSPKKPAKPTAEKYAGKEYIAKHGGEILDVKPDTDSLVLSNASLPKTNSENADDLDDEEMVEEKPDISETLEKYYEMAADWAVDAMVGGKEDDKGHDCNDSEGSKSEAALSDIVIKQEVEDIPSVQLGDLIPSNDTPPSSSEPAKHSLSFLQSSKSQRKRKMTSRFQDYNLL